jgi:hypothetical protein
MHLYIDMYINMYNLYVYTPSSASISSILLDKLANRWAPSRFILPFSDFFSFLSTVDSISEFFLFSLASIIPLLISFKSTLVSSISTWVSIEVGFIANIKHPASFKDWSSVGGYRKPEEMMMFT